MHQLTAQELRLNNFVKITSGANILVTSIYDTSISFNDGVNCCLIEDLQGIPLTPEILEKCGFERQKNVFYDNYIIKLDDYHYHSVRFDEEDDVWVYNNDRSDAGCYYVTYFSYLHELQNICYLVGKIELTVNL